MEEHTSQTGETYLQPYRDGIVCGRTAQYAGAGNYPVLQSNEALFPDALGTERGDEALLPPVWGHCGDCSR